MIEIIKAKETKIALSGSETNYCISVTNLRKSYDKRKIILNDISFNVEYGKVFGFLGPNGAGKTTTIKILTSLLNPSSGKVLIFGKDPTKDQREIKRKIGVVSQQPSFEQTLTVERALDLYGFLWGLKSKNRKDKLQEILRAFDLEEIRNMKNDDLSIGQRRRVQVAREFMHDMDLLFLDEPTVGLDPSARRTLLDYLKSQVKTGLTVFFTTHIMEEAEYLCDDIAIINNGKIIAFDTPLGLKKKYGGVQTIEVKLKDTFAKSIINLFNPITSGSHIEVYGSSTFIIRSINSQDILMKVIQTLSENKIPLESISINPPSLEEVFLKIVKEEQI